MKCLRCGNETENEESPFCSDCYHECDKEELATASKNYYSNRYDDYDDYEDDFYF